MRGMTLFNGVISDNTDETTQMNVKKHVFHVASIEIRNMAGYDKCIGLVLPYGSCAGGCRCQLDIVTHAYFQRRLRARQIVYILT